MELCHHNTVSNKSIDLAVQKRSVARYSYVLWERKNGPIKKDFWGTSLVFQWLRLYAPKAGGLDSIPDQRTRFHMPQLIICMPQLKIPGEGNGNPLQYSCLEYPMDCGAWQATVQGVRKSRTWLSTCTHTQDSTYINKGQRSQCHN